MAPLQAETGQRSAHITPMNQAAYSIRMAVFRRLGLPLKSLLAVVVMSGAAAPVRGQSLHDRILADEANDRANELIRQMRDLKNRDWGNHGNDSPNRSSGPTRAQLDAAAARERRAKATALNLEGIAYWKDGNWDYAGEKFQQAYANNPDSKQIITNLANCRNQQGLAAWEAGDWERAANMFSSALLHNPSSKVFKANLALAQQKQEEQRRKYREQLQDQRQWNLAYAEYNRGKSSADNGDYAGALAAFQAAAQLYPGEHAYVQNVAWAYSKLGDQAWQRGDTNAALDRWISALQVDPDNAYVRKQVPLVEKYLREQREGQDGVARVHQETETLSAELKSTPVPDGLGYGDLDVVTDGPFGSHDVVVRDLPAQAARTPGTNVRAGDQLKSAAAQARPDGDLTVNYDRGGGPDAGSLVAHTVGAGGPPNLSQFSERARRDPEIVAGMKEIQTLQTQRADLDKAREALILKRNLTKDPGEMQALSTQIDQKKLEQQNNLQAIADKTEAVEARRRPIDNEVEETPPETPAGK
jgi:tetratricopeptide (TPR) repeat protein